ncbi:MAG: hypothetical protein LRY33_03100 [Parabacteroides chartae]|nr:hypothetical protein [Parabacteroides chartae]
MPDKDGYSLCREVKDNLQLCHIPVILVTAKATLANQVEGSISVLMRMLPNHSIPVICSP